MRRTISSAIGVAAFAMVFAATTASAFADTGYNAVAGEHSGGAANAAGNSPSPGPI